MVVSINCRNIIIEYILNSIVAKIKLQIVIDGKIRGSNTLELCTCQISPFLIWNAKRMMMVVSTHPVEKTS